MYTLNTGLALEAIDYQRNDPFPPALTALFEKYKAGDVDKSQLCSTISKMIKDRFNLTMKTNIMDVESVNASVSLRFLDAFNIGASQMEDLKIYGEPEYYLNEKNKEHVRSILNGSLAGVGVIDYKKAKANGIFSKITQDLFFTQGLLDTLTPKALTAVTCHEIGHVFVTMEMTGVTIVRNNFIGAITDGWLNARTPEDRVRFTVAADNVWGFGLTEYAEKDASDVKAIPVIIGQTSEYIRSDKGFVTYNETMIEQSADQFMARLCPADYLAEISMHYGRGILPKWKSRNTGFISKLFNFAIESLKTIFKVIFKSMQWLFVAIALPVLIPIYIALLIVPFSGVAKTYEEYDTPYDRCKRLYKEAKNRFKDQYLTKDEALQIFKATEELANTIASMEKPKDGFMLKMRLLFSKDLRNQKEKKEYQLLAEDLMSNDLYMAAAQFKHL